MVFKISLAGAFAQQNYWQQQVDYSINVSLNDMEHSLTGFIKIHYTNHSPDTLRYIWFHVWPNAYKNDKTAFSEQMLENGNTKFYFSSPQQKGFINQLDFRVNEARADIEDHPEYLDIIKLILPSPLVPEGQIVITTPFHVKLPDNFSRGGHAGQSYQVTQWFPKPAVFDKKGWHAMPYLEQGEFYSELGNFEVAITLPRNYVVAATGELQNEEEKQWLKTRSTFTWEAIRHRKKTKSGSYKTFKQLFPISDSDTKTLLYKQANVPDFAWFADKRFIVNYDTCALESGKIIGVYSFYTPAGQSKWTNSMAYTKKAVRFYSQSLGEYPFRNVSIVEGPPEMSGGMEYPTIALIAAEKDKAITERIIAHEVGHNWFYGILATNERSFPWMDEGMNSYYENRYTDAEKKTDTSWFDAGAFDRIS
ncbi:MAG TPA: M1 family metallopeptidase, partial [Agriterribacter sp.]|nr:M1 family metallopeptidase [Agriterribacter sp.]